MDALSGWILERKSRAICVAASASRPLSAHLLHLRLQSCIVLGDALFLLFELNALKLFRNSHWPRRLRITRSEAATEIRSSSVLRTSPTLMAPRRSVHHRLWFTGSPTRASLSRGSSTSLLEDGLESETNIGYSCRGLHLIVAEACSFFRSRPNRFAHGNCRSEIESTGNGSKVRRMMEGLAGWLLEGFVPRRSGRDRRREREWPGCFRSVSHRQPGRTRRSVVCSRGHAGRLHRCATSTFTVQRDGGANATDGEFAGEHLIRATPRKRWIGTAIDGFRPFDLLGGHVMGGAHELPGLGEGDVSQRGEGFSRGPKSAIFTVPPFSREHVLGLDIPMAMP